LKLLEENIGETLQDLGIGDDFLNRTLIAQKIIGRIDKWDCIKFKRFCTAMETVTRLKREHTGWQKFLVSYSSDK
jgi:hypothetical protein